MMLAYVGPDTVAPIASGIAAVVGAILIGWRWIVKKCRAFYRFVFRIKVEEEPEVDETMDQADQAQGS